MIPRCKGTAIVADHESGKQYKIHSDEVEWVIVDIDSNRSMGTEKHYQAAIHHEELGDLYWNLWEYPGGFENHSEASIGKHKLIRDFEYGLDYDQEEHGSNYFHNLMINELTIDTSTHQNNVSSFQDTGNFFVELFEDMQVNVMIDWFYGMFQELPDQTPHAEKESTQKYIYLYGGAFSAVDVLNFGFSHIASIDVIEQAEERIRREAGDIDWVPIGDYPDLRKWARDRFEAQIKTKMDTIRERLKHSPDLKIGSEQVAKARDELNVLLDELLPLMDTATSGSTSNLTNEPIHGGIGHNNPPPDFNIPENILAKFINNFNIVKSEVESQNPDVEAASESIGIVNLALEELKEFLRQTWEKTKSIGSLLLAGHIVYGVQLFIVDALTWLVAILGL